MKPFPREISFADKYGPAMVIADQTQADEYFAACVQHTMSFGIGREFAEEAERGNLGYFAGYYDNETRERVERLFSCAHPVFGSIARNGPPSPEAAFSAGMRLGMEGKRS